MSDWIFPSGAPLDDRRDLPVFSMLPNWQGGVTERLEWLTEIFSSETVVEQRRPLRRYPRRSFEAGFLRVDNARTRLDMFLAGLGKKKCLVPLWHEQVALRTPLGEVGEVFIRDETLAMREWAVGDLALLTTGEPNVYTVLTVMSVNLTTNVMVLNSRDEIGSWPQGSRIIPLRVARVMDQVTLESPTDRVGTSQIRFQLTDADDRFVGSWGYCSPLWQIRPDRKIPLKSDYQRSDFTLDFDAGVFEVTDAGNRVEVSQSMGLKLFGREAVWAYRAFLYNARGRLHRFYVPSFTKDIVPVEDLNGLIFDAEMNGFSEYMFEPQEARLIIGVYFKDGRPTVYRTITDIQPVNATSSPFMQVGERFTVDTELPPILKRDIEKISFIVPSRFDQDVIEIQHHTSDCAAVSSSVVTRSVIVEGMPPIECWVTSQTYPVESVDGLGVGMTITQGRFAKPIGYATEAVSAAVEITGGVMTEHIIIYSEIETDVEAVSAAVEITGGVMTGTVPYIEEPEALACAIIITAGVFA